MLRHKAHPVKEGAGLDTKCRDIAIPVVRGPTLHLTIIKWESVETVAQPTAFHLTAKPIP